jgi:predicted GNAT family N-acyltransferase
MRSVNAKNSTVTIRRVSSQAELVQAFTIRIQVFVKEQRVPAEIELDSDDQRAIHFLAIKSGKVVGTARVVMKHGNAKIGRMAVLKSSRHKGIGADLLKRAVLSAKRLHARRIYLHAQVAVIGFYQRLGFRLVGRVFDEAGIAHRKMILGGELTTKSLARQSRNQSDTNRAMM